VAVSWSVTGVGLAFVRARGARSPYLAATSSRPRSFQRRNRLVAFFAHHFRGAGRSHSQVAARLPPNKRLQLTAAGVGVRRPWPAAGGSGVGPPPASGRC
jgi:hypothetical protein